MHCFSWEFPLTRLDRKRLTTFLARAIPLCLWLLLLLTLFFLQSPSRLPRLARIGNRDVSRNEHIQRHLQCLHDLTDIRSTELTSKSTLQLDKINLPQTTVDIDGKFRSSLDGQASTRKRVKGCLLLRSERAMDCTLPSRNEAQRQTQVRRGIGQTQDRCTEAETQDRGRLPCWPVSWKPEVHSCLGRHPLAKQRRQA
jgi:hypothetical protein